MTDEQPSGQAESSAPPEEEPVASLARTVEDVEAEYRSRISGKDKEAQALRAEIARLSEKDRATQAVAEAQRAQELGEVEALRRQLSEERAQRVVDTRRARYPQASETLGDDVLAAMDEGRLAALEARLTPEARSAPPPRIDANSPPRNPPAGQRGEPSIEELRAELQRLTPEYIASLNDR
jgi:hypothetical protein